MAEGNNAEQNAVGKLQTVAENGGGDVRFTPAEAVALRRLVKMVAGADALGWIGGNVKTILFTIGAIYMAWIAFGDWFTSHFKP